MATVLAPNWPRIIRSGIIAGVAAGILMEVWIYATLLLPQHTSLVQAWTFIASTALGKSAFANPAAPYIGLFMHFCVAIGWAIGYAYLAQTRAGINRHYIISGVVFGFVVMIAMQIVLMAANSYRQPKVQEFVLTLVAHVVFYGVTVASVTRIVDRQ